MEEIITTIEKIKKFYFDIILKYDILNKSKINLKNKQVKDLKLSDNFDNVATYHKYISSNIFGNLGDYLSVDKFRIKNILSIADKIERYIEHPSLRGKSSINKCLNDILGFRKYINNSYDYKKVCLNINLYFNNDKTVRAYLSEKENYIACHVYIKINNFSYPCELQLWKYADITSNEDSHSKYKQNYTKTEKEIKEV